VTGLALVFRRMSTESNPSAGSRSGTYATECTVGGSNPGTIKRLFSFPKRPSGPALGSIQPPIQWVPRSLLRGKAARDVRLTTRLYLLPRLRMARVIPLVPLYACMTWPGRLPLPLPLPIQVDPTEKGF